MEFARTSRCLSRSFVMLYLSFRSLFAISLALGPLAASAQSTPICQIQGSGPVSAYAGQLITTTGIVTAIHLGPGTLQGFFIEQPACDGDPTTSNGIFVYMPSVANIAVGDQVQVAAEVEEYNGLTELKNVSALAIVGTGVVAPTAVNLPVPATWDPEQVEGMLLQFPQTLVVNDVSDWAQYGEVVLGPQRLFTPTNFVDPNDVVASGTTSTGTSNAAVVAAQEDEDQRSMVRLDDGRSTSYPSPPPLIGPEGTLRAGSTLTGLQAVMFYSFGAYRLEPAGQVPVVHVTRPAVPAVGGQLLAASLNVLNFWTTLGGWGAATVPELDRQRTKLVAALSAMDADVFALHELENNTDAFIDLLNALNAVVSDPYLAIDDGSSGSATKSVIFYRPAVLTPSTPLFTLNTSTFQRPHHTQGFLVNATGGRFLLSLMHLRSKNCGGGAADDQDMGDGQGCFNGTRKDQVDELLSEWASIRANTGITAQLVIGDMNAYTEEDPLDILRAGGLDDLLPAGTYSYLYGGTFGALDHALGTPDLVSATTGASTWAINSDEPSALGYANVDLYQANAFRCSDHDPVLVGLNANALPVVVPEFIGQAGVTVRTTGGLATWSLPEAVHTADRIELLDLQGRVVATVQVNGTATPVMDMGERAAGAYVWRLLDGPSVSAFGKLTWCGR